MKQPRNRPVSRRSGASEQKPYQTPVLQNFGTISAATQGGSCGGMDAMGQAGGMTMMGSCGMGMGMMGMGMGMM